MTQATAITPVIGKKKEPAPSIAGPKTLDEPKREAFIPKPPASFEEAGLDPAIVESLIVKYLAGVGTATGGQVAHELCLPAEPIIAFLANLKLQQIVVHVGSAGMGDF
ncbi:MAG: hypothetical protein H6820_12250, partial [Phycisphaerales bacterium]|nr:hypothetical protein [Phycisphaerales bacterium]